MFQPTATSLITVAITALSSLALIAIISWFAWHLIKSFGRPLQADAADTVDSGSESDGELEVPDAWKMFASSEGA